MSNLNNIEKLIQMATIEHMYEMLQKIKNDINFNQLSDTIFNSSNNFLPPDNDNDNYKNEVKDFNNSISIIKSDNANMMKIIDTVLIRLYSLEAEVKELKSKNDTLSSELKKINETSSSDQFKGGQITLKIEEKNIDTSLNLAINNEGMIDKIKQLEQEVEEEEEVDEEQEEAEEEQEEVEEEEEVDEEQEEAEEEQEEVDEEQEEVEEQEEEADEEQEEVDEEQEEEVEEEEVNQKEKKEEQQESLEEEDDEEVFEIEIDDITYFTSDEENGILYEVTSDGEVGKKVGIIKNGEPIFS
jgi:DNA repair exonuclease SbcCD ATPase subunit